MAGQKCIHFCCSYFKLYNIFLLLLLCIINGCGGEGGGGGVLGNSLNVGLRSGYLSVHMARCASDRH